MTGVLAIGVTAAVFAAYVWWRTRRGESVADQLSELMFYDRRRPGLERLLVSGGSAAALIGLLFSSFWWMVPIFLIISASALNGDRPTPGTRAAEAALYAVFIAGGLLWALTSGDTGGYRVSMAGWMAAMWLFGWAANEAFASGSAYGTAWGRTLAALWFSLVLLALWEIGVRAFQIPSVLLPPPSMIAARFAASTGVLWADFAQTFLKATLIGYVTGCGLGFLTAIAIDRSPFLQKGLVPIGNLVSALPIIGVAPIMVMWFGFDWPSKAAVVIVMVFFPMLVNTLEGLRAADAMQRDMMRTWAASYWQTLIKLRLPAAAPFIFNALKICSTLALIGAIVAEFFGTPIVGMGFRISTEVGRMNIDMVWAEIAVAALAGSAFYGAITLLERAVTFWHPSVRG